MDTDRLRRWIRDVPDFPQPGILFRDITPLLRDAAALEATVEALAAPYRTRGVGVVAGIEARGFILGPAVALRLGVGFVPIRKAGKLPGEVARQEYELEYGASVIEVHRDAIAAQDRVLLLDDVLATGGTAAAAARLVAGLGAEIAGLSFLIELTDLGGRAGLGGHHIESLLQY